MLTFRKGEPTMKHIKLTTKKPPILANGCCECICAKDSQKKCFRKGVCPNPKDHAVPCYCVKAVF